MKKLILITPILLCVHFAQAQFENKQFVLGGNISYNTTSGGSFGSNTLFISPMLGKAIKENQLITAQFGFSNSSGSSYLSRGYSVGLGFRNYYKVSDNLFFNWQAGGNFRLSEFENKLSNETNNTSEFGAALSPGLSWLAAPRLLLESRFGNIYYNRVNSNGGVNEFGMNLNQLSFGFTLKL